MATAIATARGLGTRSPRATPRARRGLVGAVLVLVLLAVAGAVVGLVIDVGLVRTRGERAALAALADPATPGLRMGQPVRTGFGAVTVTGAAVDNGLTSEDLGGMNHGVSSLVSQGHAQVTALVTLNNTSHRDVPLQASQFRLVRQRGTGPQSSVAASATTLQAGTLPARTGVDVRVTFVTPTDGSRLWLHYTAPAGAGRHPAAVLVVLGTTSSIKTPPPGHQH